MMLHHELGRADCEVKSEQAGGQLQGLAAYCDLGLAAWVRLTHLEVL